MEGFIYNENLEEQETISIPVVENDVSKEVNSYISSDGAYFCSSSVISDDSIEPVIKGSDNSFLLHGYEYIQEDRNGDGVIDAVHIAEDIDGDGGVDRQTSYYDEDLNHNSRFEEIDFNKPVGLFRHSAIRYLKKHEYNKMRTELYDLLNSLSESMIDKMEFDDLNAIKMNKLA